MDAFLLTKRELVVREKIAKEFLRPGELFFASLITGFSVLALWQAYEISGFTGLSTPGVFPMLAAATMLVSAFFILSDALSRRRVKSTTGNRQMQVLTGRLSLVVALVTAYVFAMPYFGFMLSSAVFLFVSFAFLWRKNVVISTLLAAGTLVAIYLVFRLLFQVVLPRGSLLQGWW